MEFILFFIALFLLFLLKPFTKQNRNKSKNKLPPRPWKLPLVGNLLQIGTLPHRSITTLAKKHGPIIYLQLGEIPTIVISSARLAKEALTKQDLALANRQSFLATKVVFYNHTDIAFSPYGNYWRQMRKICTLELLSVKKVQSFRSIREKEVQKFIKSINLSSGSAINLSKRIFLLQNVITCKATIGDGSSFPQDELLDIIVRTVSLMGGFTIADLFPSFKFLHFLFDPKSRLQKMHRKLDRILDNIICEHKQKLGVKAEAKEDLLDVLSRLKENNGLEFPITSSNIKAIIMDMFSAGTDTSSLTIEWAMAEMIRNKRVMNKAQAEVRQVLKGKKIINEADIKDLNYLKLVIKETLRLHSPAPFLLPRQCREECEIGGYAIPIKTQIILNAWAIARDPEFWDDPESFMPERFENTSLQFNGTNFEYIPFGAGRRMCPGISFGIASVELTLSQLLYHFDWKLANGVKPEDLDMSETFGVTVKMKNNLHVVAIPYS